MHGACASPRPRPLMFDAERAVDVNVGEAKVQQKAYPHADELDVQQPREDLIPTSDSCRRLNTTSPATESRRGPFMLSYCLA